MAVFGVCKAMDPTQSLNLPKATVLEKFPCEGGPIAQLLFLARHALKLNVELLRLRGDLTWASWSQAFWLLRFLSALLLPHKLHITLAAPLATYLTRAGPLVALVLAGPGRPLSPINAYFVFGFGGVGDAFLALTQPTLHVWPELAYNALNLLAVALLCRWHGAASPDLPARLEQQLLMRLALIAGVHCLSWVRRARARDAAAGAGSGVEAGGTAASALAGPAAGGGEAAAGASSGGGIGGGVAALLAGACPGSSSEPFAACAKAGTCKAGGSSSGAGAGESVLPEPTGVPDAAVHVAVPAACAAGDGQRCTCDPKSPCHNAGLPKPHPAITPAAAPAAAACAASFAAADAAADAIRMAQRCLAEADADPMPALPLVPPPYRSAVRRRTTRIKIPGCEPGQIGAGFTQRLQTLAAERGVMLSGVYIREGCIELVLDELSWSQRPAAAAAAAAADMVRLGVESGYLDSDHLLGEEVTRGAQLAAAAAAMVAPPPPAGAAAGSPAASAGVQALLAELERELAAWEGAWGVPRATTEEAEMEVEEVEEHASGEEEEPEEGQGLGRRGNSAPIALAGGGAVGVWDLDAVVSALHLSSDSDGSNSAGGAGGSSNNNNSRSVRVDISAVTQQVASMGRAAAAARGSDSAFDLHEPLVVELQPRALLLPPPPPAAGPAATAATAAAAAGADAKAEAEQEQPVARLRAVVSGHAPLPALSVGAGADGAAAAAGNADADAAADAPVEVVLRCGGEYLRARVATDTAPPAAAADNGAAAAVPVTTYEVELMQRPQCGAGAGCVMVLELRAKGRLGHILPVLLLSGGGGGAADHQHDGAAAIVDELQALAAAVYGMRAARSRNGMAVGELDDLLLDLGTWMAAPTATTAATAATAAPTVTAAAPTAAAVSQRFQLELGADLLRYADATGALPATARRLRGDLARAIDALRRSRPPAAAPAAAAVADAAPAAAAVAAAAGGGEGGAGGEGAGASSAPPATAAALPAAGPPPGAVQRPRFAKALQEALGLAALGRAGAEAAAEEAAYQAYAEPLIFAQGHVIQAVEALSLAALLFRARHDLLSPGNLTTLAGCCTGTATSLAWLMLPRQAWVRLVNAAKVPRYLMYMLSKLMIGCLGFPTPPGLVPYQLGPAMLVMEGVILPGSNLLPFPAALAITLAKWPLAIAMMLGSGATDDVAAAALIAARAALVALATTALCHAYLRYSFSFQRCRRAQAAAAGGAAGAASGLRGASGAGGSGGALAVGSGKDKVE
ncbi:hypothetical protein HXX76_006440 [Chlamydomonas incerta]|uniref:Uncharacterized protein n=1 Tax=Chlamydomonas incerta TaxID=51695 RepID=A0A835T3Z2_CHLIN|nr:hypothetical protein HXX76_006440 [Chlamydomonas incerta]|eukprot:KAG2436921.1 hypothetical protein HXX76_006440 [Chlamydomonas incerta]